jgi:hypothetical protein
MHSRLLAFKKLPYSPLIGGSRSISVESTWKSKQFMSLTVPETENEEHLTEILTNNKKWVSDRKNEDPEYFDKLAKPQNPRYLYIGCSDSRISANNIMGLG